MTRIHHFWNLERALLLFFFIIAVAMLIMSQDFVRDARLFPEIIASAVMLFSAYVLIVQTIAWRKGRDEPGEWEKPALHWLVSLAMVVGMALIIYGFGLGTGILLFVTVMSVQMGQKWYFALLFGSVLSVVLWYAFGILLKIPMPAGLILPLY